MLDIKLIRSNPNKIKEACRKKGVIADIDQLLEVDKKRLDLLKALEDIRAKKNKANQEIQEARDPVEKEAIIMRMRELDRNNDRLDAEFQEIDKKFQELMLELPNPPADDVKEGKDESENEIIRKRGRPTEFSFEPKDHLALGEALDIIDVERAAKVSGARFGYLKGKAALLEFALIRFAIETLMREKFIPVIPPALIKEESMKNMGYLEHGGSENMYILKEDGLVLVGTSEQSIGPMHADEILDAKILPLRYTGFSSCFRREAGTYGKDTRGILRVHQFDKVEMFSFCLPEESEKEHEFLLGIEEKLFQALRIPYQVVKMCSGDLGIPAARKYDIEAWLPGQQKYREVTSASTCTDFQARRLNIRYRDQKTNKTEFVHMLNGTAFAIGRTIIAILENYQQKDGSIKIPDALQKYTGFKEIKK